MSAYFKDQIQQSDHLVAKKTGKITHNELIPAQQAPRDREPIAIVGIGGRFPKSENLETFWSNLEQGVNMVDEIPSDRWDWRKFFGEDAPDDLKANSKWGGFIKDHDCFDAGFFAISPREAEVMDPEQRIFLESAWQAIEDSGHRASELSGTNTGVFLGVTGFDYMETPVATPEPHWRLHLFGSVQFN